jgi:predicted AlkP superfamily phosphohydrolase/phosphomutase
VADENFNETHGTFQPRHTIMRRAPRVAVIALDGFDPESIARYIEAGWLPELAKAFSRARQVELQSLGGLFLNSPWPCAVSGVAVENHGIHAFRPIRSGTLDIVEGADRHVPTPFWETAVRAGLRASVLDVPVCGPPPGEASLEGLRFLEWGTHPNARMPGSYPGSLLSEIVDRHGPHPCRDDDPALMTVEELTAVQIRLCEGIRARERIIVDMLDHDQADLVVAAFSEGHIAGHQFMNLTVPGHPRYEAGVAAELGDKLRRRVLEAVDAAVGRILERLPPETTVLVACMGGLRATFGGSYFLEDMLRRTGLTASVAVQPSLAQRLWRLIPERIRQVGRRRMTGLVRRHADSQFWASFDWSATRAFALPWTYDGYLRVNQRGREPHGIVAPGAERAELLDQIEAMLGELRIAGTDKPAVRQVVRTQEVYAGCKSAELPDLMVLWNNGQPIDAIESPRVGRIRNRDIGPRGSHTDPGTVFAWGPEIATGPTISGIRDIDIAPTVLALLGIAAPEGLDGRVVANLLRSTRRDRLTA